MIRRRTENEAKQVFWSKVRMVGLIGCWEWIGGLDTRGYGQMGYLGRKWRTHRLAFLFRNGSIPDGMDVLHNCDNKICVNPAHLYPGTDKENARDARLRNRWLPFKGEAHGMAKLSNQDVIHIRSSTESAKALTDKFNVKRESIYHVRNGHTWRHIL